jgi:predicted GNAT family N-acyltransferase
MWNIEKLTSKHDRSTFDCGKPALNDWLKQRARQWDRKDLARTYVLVPQGKESVVGYYCLSSHYVRYEALPADQSRGIPTIDIPVVLIGRLAVSQSNRGQGLGGVLLVDALRRTSRLAESVGVRAVEVHAADDSARKFYLKYGFVALVDDPNHLWLPMTVVRKLYP